MMRPYINTYIATLAFLIMLPLKSLALTIDGYEIPQVIPATSDHAELKLNGASMRVVYGVVDSYIGKLYLEHPVTDEKALVEADEFKRMTFQVVMKRISGRRMAKAMYDALQLNLSAEEAANLEARLQNMVDMFEGSLRQGQEGYIEWVPGVGSRIVIKGELKGIIPGKDLNDAILNIWVGDNPVGATFKRQVLGLEEYQPPKSMRRKGGRR
jgi:hypothetical protein